MNKTSRRKFVRFSLILGNFLLFLIVSVFILANRSASQTVRSSTLNSTTSTAGTISNPLDHLSSAQIALTAAQAARLPELTSVRMQADSDSLTLNVVPNDNTTIAKPQIVTTAQKSKQDIKSYVAQDGDTLASLAAKFGVSANTIKWSNNLSGNNITAGTRLTIPPINGIVYTVKAGDTPSSLATRYQSDPNQIIVFNDAEITGLKPGDQIIIPNGQVAAPVLTYGVYVATYTAPTFAANYGSNGYDYGWCTWYVASRVAVPNNWGNANTWDNYAPLTPGWRVSSVPSVGAIAQTDGMSYLGHVAVVDAVSPDGAMIKYSDMNGLVGWGRIGYSNWVPASTFPRYISR